MSRADFLSRRSAAKRDQIVAAARALFAAEGFGGPAMERIAREAGVSTATLYRHFGSRLELFAAVLQEGLAGFETALAAGSAADPVTRLAWAARAYAELLDRSETAGLLRAVFAAAPADPALAAMFYERVKAKVAGAIHEAVAAAVAAGRVRPTDDPADSGGHLLGMIEHAIVWRRLLADIDGPLTPATIAERALAAFWRAYALDTAGDGG